MKTIFLSLLTMTIFCTSTFAQTERDYVELVREVIKMEKKVAVTEVMQFTDAESKPFWELYNEYNFELNKVQNLRISTIKDFAAHYENMTNEKADELWNNAIAYQQNLLKIKKSYYKKFKKIIPAGKAAQYFQVENKIEALVNASLAMEIPLIETK